MHCAWPKSHLRPKRPQKPLERHLFREEMLVLVAFSLDLLGLDSHLLQRVAHFNPLSLYSWFSRPSGRISIAAQVAHLIREGCI